LEYFINFWNILWTFGIFYEHLVQFVFFLFLVSCTEKNLATLFSRVLHRGSVSRDSLDSMHHLSSLLHTIIIVKLRSAHTYTNLGSML
jgi:hypothetical protein